MLPAGKDTRPLMLKLVVEATPGPLMAAEEYYETIVDIPDGWYVTGIAAMVPDYSVPQSRWLKVLHFPFTLDGEFYVRWPPGEIETTRKRFHLEQTPSGRLISRGVSAVRRGCRRWLAMVRHQ